MTPSDRDRTWTWIGGFVLATVVAGVAAVILVAGDRPPGRVQAVAFAAAPVR